MDAIDKAILRELQRDATISIADLSRAAGLSQTPCWRRVKRLEEAGAIQRRVAIVDPAAVNLALTAFVAVRTSQHTEAWLRKFTEGVRSIPEVVELHRMSGDVDYLLKVVCPDMRTFDGVYKKLIRVADLTDVSSTFSMEALKYTTELPLDYA
jgi:Lrp/AsnC family transcriptional regulator